MSFAGHHFSPLMGKSTQTEFKRQLSASKILENAYLMGLPSFSALMKEWGIGEVFVSSTLEDEIFIENFVGDVVLGKITPRKNCAIKRVIELLMMGDTYRVAKLFASHARLYRQSHNCALAGQTMHEYTQYEEALNPDYFDEEKEEKGLEKAINDGAPLGVAKKRGKAHAQVTLCGVEYVSTNINEKKTVKNVQPKKETSFAQATLF